MEINIGPQHDALEDVRRAKRDGLIVFTSGLALGAFFEYLSYKGFRGGEYGVGAVLGACGLGAPAVGAILGTEWVDDARNRLEATEAGVADTIHTPSLLIGEGLPPEL